VELVSLLSGSNRGAALPGLTVHGRTENVDVTAICNDSRAVRRGSLFCCFRGLHADGHDHAEAAVAAGAVALLCERPLHLGVVELRVASARAAMGPLAATLNGHPSDRLAVIGVTGTNGKTTTTHLLQAVLEHAGRPCGVIGTLTGARTTPEAPDLQATLADMLAEGRQAVAMEVSSHALDLHRVDGTNFAIAVFTNLSMDHLDYHGDMAAYFHAKAQLFRPDLSQRAVVNLDDRHGRLLRDAADVATVGYSLDHAVALELDAAGSSFTWRGHAVRLRLAGRFNVSNAIAAATTAAEIGIDPELVADGLSSAGPVEGRFELIDEGQPFLVVVDYAHTPDGLDQLLTAARELVAGRVVVVFGAGGDRDRTKRSPMGAVAATRADVVVLTSDNPRNEDPAAIISAVEQGVALVSDRRAVMVETDRRSAISMALSLARAGDVVVIAGKGHETTQVVGDAVTPFDDRLVAKQLLAEMVR
jgi:UDP-N-acetylmuramoyl-L-alanyl-D-glutamate--2,6-diaminopimelate ligase